MAKLYVYDSYENRMLVYNNLNENAHPRRRHGHKGLGLCGAAFHDAHLGAL